MLKHNLTEMNFLKNVLASTLGVFFAILILFFLIASIFATIATFISSENGSYDPISDHSILLMDLNMPIAENPPSIEKFQKSLGLSEDRLDLQTILNSIKIAKKDQRIKGILINSGMPMTGWAQTKTIRDELKSFKESGKFIYSHSDFYTQKGYYLSSIADSIFINILGNVEFKGLSSEVLYYKDFQEKYGFKMEVVRNGKYKSAVEPFLENTMSKENKSQIKSLLDDYWDIIRSEISDQRKINLDKIDLIATNLKSSTSILAIELGLIDKELYRDELKEIIKKSSGVDSLVKLDYIKPDRLVNNVSTRKKGVRDLIAIVYAQGTIIYGEGSDSSIGKEVFVEAIEEASNNKRIKAIVLRIDSPGGSAITSDIIWNSIEKAKQKKPVVVSMGNIAASGGYYIACNADKIVANPFTITGSIGVFALLPNIDRFSKSIGINAQSVSTHKNALGYSVFEEISPDFEKHISESIKDIYSTFKYKVSIGRNISLDDVEQIAQGRVWTGKQALENKLIDKLGNLEDALILAKELAEIEDYNTITFPQIEPNIENIFKTDIPFGSLNYFDFENMDQNLKNLVNQIKNFDKKINFQTQLPFLLQIE